MTGLIITSDAEKLASTLYDIDVEQAALGACLVDNGMIARLQIHVLPRDFWDPLHQRIAARMFEDHDAGFSVTPLTLAVRLRADPGMKEIGEAMGLQDNGKHYIANLALAAPAVPNVEELAQLIAELSDKRSAAIAMSDAQEFLKAGHPAGKALAPVITVADQAEARRLGVSDTQTIAEAAQVLLHEMEQGTKRPEGDHAPSGSMKLDKIIGGLYPENLIVIGGRPGMGKSIAGTTMARAAAQAGWAPHVFSLEMSGRETAARLIADLDFDHAKLKGKRPLHFSKMLQHKPMTDDEWQRAIMAQGEFQSLAIEINDRDRLTIAQIANLARARAARLATNPSVQDRQRVLVIIDHLHIVEPSERYGGRRVDEISEITKVAKQLAKRLKVPVVLLAQLNRGVEGRDDKVPVMADFRDSGSVEQDADIILGLYRPAYYAQQMIRQAKNDEMKIKALAIAETQKNVLKVAILKNRNGPADEIDLFIDVASAAIRDDDPDIAHNPRDDELKF